MTKINFSDAKKFIAVIFAATLLTACSLNTRPVDSLARAPEGVTPPAPLPAPAVHMTAYRLQVGDVLDIKMMLNPELNDQVIVRPDGMISTTVAQDVPAYGHTVAELRAELEQQYRKHLKDPEIAVLVRSFAPNRVYVLGEVNTPGEFITVGPNLTMLQAIARAGGFKPSAEPEEIVVLRRGESEQPTAYLADYKAAVNGTDPAADIRLAAYDVVVVPKSGVANAYLYFQQYLQQFVPDAFNMSYELNPTNVH